MASGTRAAAEHPTGVHATQTRALNDNVLPGFPMNAIRSEANVRASIFSLVSFLLPLALRPSALSVCASEDITFARSTPSSRPSAAHRVTAQFLRFTSVSSWENIALFEALAISRPSRFEQLKTSCLNASNFGAAFSRPLSISMCAQMPKPLNSAANCRHCGTVLWQTFRSFEIVSLPKKRCSWSAVSK